MNDSKPADKDTAKFAKKAAKAQTKIEKKRVKLQDASHSSSARNTTIDYEPVAAQRSAAAAEKQVRMQWYRVLIALLTLAVALATFLITVKPWERRVPTDIPSKRSDTGINDSSTN